MYVKSPGKVWSTICKYEVCESLSTMPVSGIHISLVALTVPLAKVAKILL